MDQPCQAKTAAIDARGAMTDAKGSLIFGKWANAILAALINLANGIANLVATNGQGAGNVGG